MMDRLGQFRNIILVAVMVWGLAMISACDDSPKQAAPVPKPKMVSKPIAHQAVSKTEGKTAEVSVTAGTAPSQEKAVPATTKESPTAAPVTEDQIRRETAESEKQVIIPGGTGTPEMMGTSLFQSQETYDFRGRVNPFIPLISAKAEEPAPEAEEEKPPKRILTPLEKMELSQIKLVAILQSSKGSMAMVEEASGKGYEVRVGTYMGRNGGKVTAINSDEVVITEYYKDYQGKRRERIQEVKFHKSEGGE